MPNNDDKKKRKRADKALIRKRLDLVLDLMILRRMSDRKIRQVLVESEGIHPKTADRYIKKARKLLAAVGLQSTAEERGLLWERLEELYFAAQSSEKPDLALLNQILRTQLDVHKTNPNIKGGKNNENTAPAAADLSPELASILEKLRIEDATQES